MGLKYIPLDIETSGLSFKKNKIIGIGVGNEYKTPDSMVPNLPYTAQNGRFEHHFLKAAGIEFNWAFDTLLASSILLDRPEKLDLASLAEHYLGMDSWKSDTDKMFKKKNWYELFLADPKLQAALAERNIYDLTATGALTEILLDKLDKENMTDFYFKKLHPTAKLLAEMEYGGMRIDVDATKAKLVQIEDEIASLLARLNVWAAPQTINFNSPAQLKPLLKSKGYELWGYDFQTKEMKESTSSETLERLLPSENIQLLLDYRGAVKLKAFLEGWIEDQIDGYIYPSYNVANTRTGRLSCSSPNLQQVPRDKEVRSLFIPPPGKVFIVGDYAQVEVRIAAHYTQDEMLLKVFTDDLDFYGSIAVNVLGVDCQPNEVKAKYPEMRFVAKQIGLSVLYGIGAAKLASMIKRGAGVEYTKEDCQRITKEYFKAYPKLLEFRNYIIGKIEGGEILRTHYGRQFKINPEKSFSTGINTIIQSTASDACLFSQLQIEEELKKQGISAPLVAMVHDEVIRECAPEHAETVGKIMEDIMCNQGFDCPLKFEWTIGKSWGDKK